MSTTTSKNSVRCTRSATNIWLVGHPLASIEEPSQLPVCGIVLRRVYYETKNNKTTLPDACSTVADEVISTWMIANITTTAKPHVVDKLKRIHQDHRKLLNHKTRRTAQQMSLEADFTISMSKLFDIAHANWERRTKVPEARQFLVDQRGDRKLHVAMNTRDLTSKLCTKQEPNQPRQQQEEKCTQAALLSDDSSLSDIDIENEPPYQPTPHFNKATKRQSPVGSVQSSKRCIIEDPLFNAALDRTRTSTRQAMMIITPALSAAGIDVNQLALSRSSLMEARIDSRQTLGSTIRQEFKPTTPLVAHFDGKLLHLDGKKHDNLAIVVSGLEIEKLLGIPILSSGTGAQMGQQVIELVREWPGVEQHLAGLCFDTTASNTGVHTGAITVVQNSFNRRLLFLACRHHVFEIYATAVFDQFFTSRGPDIPLFGRFKSQWNNIDKSLFDTLDSDETGAGCLKTDEKVWLDSRRAAVIGQLHQHLEIVQPRDDYLEFLKLTLQLLGEDIPLEFRAPGAYHRARWMAKGIYCLKMFGFRHQFQFRKCEIESLRRICLYVCTLYASFWFSAPLATHAATNDLHMLQLTEDYQAVDKEIATIAEKKMRLHLWYLSEDLAALPLFSKDTPDDEKESIVKALKRKPHAEDVRRLAAKKVKSFKDLSVANFVTRRSLNLFEALHLSKEYLTLPVNTWCDHEGYAAAIKIVLALKVVNDCAERAVKLASDFHDVLTRNDQQRQLLYQVVEHHRKLLPTSATKTQLVAAHSK